jgi:hypothetical protein
MGASQEARGMAGRFGYIRDIRAIGGLMVFPFPQNIVLTPSAGLADCDKLFEQRRSPQIPRTARAIEVNRPTVHKQPARFHRVAALCVKQSAIRP